MYCILRKYIHVDSVWCALVVCVVDIQSLLTKNRKKCVYYISDINCCYAQTKTKMFIILFFCFFF